MATWQEYERLARDDLADRVGSATLTGAGTDHGIDIRAPGHVAQVKAHLRPVGRPDLQRLVGAAGDAATVFYSLGGYSSEAVVYAEQVAMALFEFTVTGGVEPVNVGARTLGGAQHPDDRQILDRYQQMRTLQDEGGRDRNCAVCGRTGPATRGGLLRMWRDRVAAGPFDTYWLVICDEETCREQATDVVAAVADAERRREASDPALRASRERRRLIHHARARIDELGLPTDTDDRRWGVPGVPGVTVTDVMKAAGLPPDGLWAAKFTDEQVGCFPRLMQVLDDVEEAHIREETDRLAADPVDADRLAAAEVANSLLLCGHPDCDRSLTGTDTCVRTATTGFRIEVCANEFHREWADRAVDLAIDTKYQGRDRFAIARQRNAAQRCASPACDTEVDPDPSVPVSTCGRIGCRAYAAWVVTPDLDTLHLPVSSSRRSEQRMLELGLSSLKRAIRTNLASRCPRRECQRLLADDCSHVQQAGVSLWHCDTPANCRLAAQATLRRALSS